MATGSSAGHPIDVTGGPSPVDAAELRERLHSFNADVTGFQDGRAIGCVLRDEHGRIVAGVDGFTWGGYGRIEYLWVDEAVRGRGLGRSLVTAVLVEARARGCSTVVVDTHSFQAPGFYERLGFVEVGRTEDTPVGHHQVLYQRSLLDPLLPAAPTATPASRPRNADPHPGRSVDAMDTLVADERAMLEAMLDVQRAELARLLAQVDDTAARARLVSSLTTPLGLVKHATFVEKVWFHSRVAGVPRAELGLPDTVDESFTLEPADTVDTVRADFLTACERSRQIAGHHHLDETFPWRDATVSLRFIYLHLIAELARHAGHADILVEQLRAGAGAGNP